MKKARTGIQKHKYWKLQMNSVANVSWICICNFQSYQSHFVFPTAYLVLIMFVCGDYSGNLKNFHLLLFFRKNETEVRRLNLGCEESWLKIFELLFVLFNDISFLLLWWNRSLSFPVRWSSWFYDKWYMINKKEQIPRTFTFCKEIACILRLMQKRYDKLVLWRKTNPLLGSKFSISHQVDLIGKVHGHGQLDQEVNTESITTLGYNWASCNKTSNCCKLQTLRRKLVRCFFLFCFFFNPKAAHADLTKCVTQWFTPDNAQPHNTQARHVQPPNNHAFWMAACIHI